MRPVHAGMAVVAIGCATASARATLSILLADGSPATAAQATKTFNADTGGWTIVLKDLYDIGGWSSYDIHGDAGEIIDDIVIDIPCWEVNGNCQPAGSPAVVNVISDPPLGISTVRNIVQTGTAETILSDVTVEQDLGAVEVEVIGILRAGRDVIGPIRSTTADNPNRGITKVEAQRDILGDVTADNGRIVLVVAYGSIGTEAQPVTIRARHDITQIAGFIETHADINTRHDGGSGRLFAFGTPRFTGRLETERLYSNPYNGWPGRVLVTGSMEGTIVLGKSFTDPSQWMEMPAGGLHGQIVINADNAPAGAWTAPVYIGDVEDENRITLTDGAYTVPAAALGGGSVGLAPFALHDESCTPTNGSTVSAAADLAVLLRHYGPIQTTGAAPLTIERRPLGSAGPWTPADLGVFTIDVDPADANALRVAGFDGGTEYRLAATNQLASNVPGSPAVAWAAPYIVHVEADESPCPTDTNGDASVDALDLLYMIGTWGTGDATADFNDDGAVDALDYLMLIASWGPC